MRKRKETTQDSATYPSIISIIQFPSHHPPCRIHYLGCSGDVHLSVLILDPLVSFERASTTSFPEALGAIESRKSTTRCRCNWNVVCSRYSAFPAFSALSALFIGSTNEKKNRGYEQTGPCCPCETKCILANASTHAGTVKLVASFYELGTGERLDTWWGIWGVSWELTSSMKLQE